VQELIDGSRKELSQFDFSRIRSAFGKVSPPEAVKRWSGVAAGALSADGGITG
jgi:hypothetical protein